MNNKIYTIGILSLIMFMISSCERTALVEPPVFIKKPVIMCLISPKSEYIYAQLSYTKPYWGASANIPDEYILDANVELVDLTVPNSVNLSLFSSKGVYRADTTSFHIASLHNYKVIVTLPNGKVYYATSQVPPKPDLSKLKMTFHEFGASTDISVGPRGGIYSETPLLQNFQYTGDLNTNFYASMQVVDSIENKFQIAQEVVFKQDVNSSIIQGSNSGVINIFNNQSVFFEDAPLKLISVQGAFYTMDKAYSEFYKTQEFYGSVPSPFSEPLILSTNFSDGAIGVFGSYDFVKGLIYHR